MRRALIAARTLIAVGLLIGIYVLALVLAALDTLVVFEFLVHQTRDEAGSTTNPVAILASVPAVGAVFWGLATVSRPSFTLAESVALSEQDAPRLWRLTDELARTLGTEAPSEIHLTAEVNAAVTEESWLLGLVAGRRRLYLGLPLLLGMTEDELRAVLGHELGHYAALDTRLAAVVHRGSQSLHQLTAKLELLGRASSYTRTFAWVVRKVFAGYTLCFDLVTLAMARQQERAADARAVHALAVLTVRRGGPSARGEIDAAGAQARRTTADAFRALSATSHAWEDLVVNWVRPGHHRGIAPADVFAVFAAMLGDPGYGARFDQLRMSLPEPRRSVRDTHPPLAARIAALGAVPERTDAPGPPAIGLLVDWAAPAGRLQRVAAVGAPDTPVERLPLHDWRQRVAEIVAAAAADRLLAAAAGRSGRPDPGTGTVLDLLRDGQAPQLARALAVDRGPRRLARRRDPDLTELTGHLTALVGQLLHQGGYVRRQPSWLHQGGMEPMSPFGPDLGPLPALIRAAPYDPAAVEELRDRLTGLGVDLTARPRLTDRPAARSATGPEPAAPGDVGIRRASRLQALLDSRGTPQERRVRLFSGLAILVVFAVGLFAAAYWVAGHPSPDRTTVITPYTPPTSRLPVVPSIVPFLPGNGTFSLPPATSPWVVPLH
ncbi:M48 family metallopeptidase [Streptomyces sp. NBC_01198]|uniref:M48 family metallopeptidase n=1 Tax=Streptomyces sp. NBC_01198 TaxID=2903769 RepID=UPI002E15663E|nr:M48 family metalloprotease [Streptomyces sp. NBC_01198]